MKYDPDMKPCKDESGNMVGVACPSCRKPVIAMLHPNPLDVTNHVDEATGERDGSTVSRCDRCYAPLRMNPKGFVFLNQ